MCQPGSTLKFCTCIDEEPELSIAPNDKEENERHVGRILPLIDSDYIWILVKHVGVKKNHVMGSLVTPSSEIDGGLTKEFVLEQLNTNECFDFDYKPVDNDIISIRPNNANYLFNFITVKFKDGKWEGSYINGFTDITRLVDRGKLKVVPPPPGYKVKKPFRQKISEFFKGWLRT